MKYDLLGAASQLALLTAFGIALPGAAKADLSCTGGGIPGSGNCTESISLSPTATDFSGAILTIDKWVSNAIPGFTESLSDVKVTVGGNYASSGSFTNLAGQSESFNFSVRGELDFSAGMGAPGTFLSGGLSVFANTANQPFNVAQGGSAPFTENFSLGPFSEPTITTGLSGFTGPGTFQADVSSLTAFTIGNNNIAQSGTTTAAPSLTIEYDFDNSALPPPSPPASVPEPTSLAAFGVGLAGLGALRRRRKR